MLILKNLNCITLIIIKNGARGRHDVILAKHTGGSWKAERKRQGEVEM